MSIQYDPDDVPDVSAEMIDIARGRGLQIVNVICDEEGAQVGDNTGVSFTAMTPFLPRSGDPIRLEDGRMCQTVKAYFAISRRNGQLALVPNVYATLINDEHKQGS